MEALSLTPLEPIESFRWNGKASDLWDAIAERFHVISELSTEGTLWQITITIIAFLLLVLGIYVSGWSHVSCGP